MATNEVKKAEKGIAEHEKSNATSLSSEKKDKTAGSDQLDQKDGLVDRTADIGGEDIHDEDSGFTEGADKNEIKETDDIEETDQIGSTRAGNAVNNIPPEDSAE